MSLAQCIEISIGFTCAVVAFAVLYGRWLAKCTPPMASGRSFRCLDCGAEVASPLLICPDREACADRQMERMIS